MTRFRIPLTLLLTALLAQWPAMVTAYDDDGGMPGVVRSIEPALGINPDFGRWTSAVRLVYDPDGAPSQFPSGKMQALIAQATAQWERVCGIHFEIVGVNPAAKDDSGLPFAQQDGLVRIHWEKSSGWAGLAGPDFAAYDYDRGYFPYGDGDVKLNDDPSSWQDDEEMVATLVHEFGHLIGLGHSDSPLSVMYANPYNHLNYPREDDIRGAQALYGAGNVSVDPVAGVSEWHYSVPAAASAATLQYLFKPNERVSTGAYLSLSGAPSTALATLGNNVTSGQFVRLNTGGYGAFGNARAINLKPTLVVLDPDGYQWASMAMDLSCPAFTACGNSWAGVITTDVMKTYPGTWRFLLVDNTSNVLLLDQRLAVTTTVSLNAPPVARASAKAGPTSTQVTFTLSATDPDGDNITVIWHPPGKNDRNNDHIFDAGFSEPLGSSGQVTQTFDFGAAGTYMLFAELKDNGPRYDGSEAGTSSAGYGFSTLVRFDVTLPLNGFNGGVMSYLQHGADPVAVVPVMVAQAQTLKATSTGGATTALYTAGASKDNGATTATTFRNGDSVVIGGTLKPQAADLGKSASLYVVIRAVIGGRESWLYRDSSGRYLPWSRVVADLKPVFDSSSLGTSSVLDVYKGQVGTGTFDVFLGYRVAGSNVLQYSLPLQLTVTN